MSFLFADLTAAMFAGVDLTHAGFDTADLTDAVFLSSNLDRATLKYVDADHADFSYARLTGADLTGADLTQARLTGADLAKANLTGAILTGADLTGANLADVIYDEPTIWPTGVRTAPAIVVETPALRFGPARRHRPQGQPARRVCTCVGLERPGAKRIDCSGVFVPIAGGQQDACGYPRRLRVVKAQRHRLRRHHSARAPRAADTVS
ncbi:pentapeptide repeat-containing protein [Nocardia sp. NPDC047648]|uniref:pentapeptide repeat-containing protein n=1 Tax=Nocardia sp. NPDC047648 TaxID=3155625 RepID=UPI0033EB9E29